MSRLPCIVAAAAAALSLAGCVSTVTTYSLGAAADPTPPSGPVETTAPIAALGPCKAPPFKAPPAVLEDKGFTAGTVGVEVAIAPAGAINRVTLVRSSGSAALDAAVVEHMYKVSCSFKPPLAQPVVTRQQFSFQR